jgi:uncharacterized membrane protein YqjE
MAFRRQKSSLTGSEPGLKEELASFAKGLKSYLGARSELLAIEAKEAAAILGKKAGLGGLAVFGYLLFLIFGIGIIGQVLNPNTSPDLRTWVGGALILACCHLLSGIFLLMIQKRTKVSAELFEVTRAELKKDQEWLNNEKES